ncbi:MAG: DUF2306 domain-containing protein [Pseudomonadota bacterium]
MNFTPLVSAGPVVLVHAVMAMLAVVVGALQFVLAKGTFLHKLFGWCWVALMALVALSSFGIHELRLVGPFSPIHLLSVLVLYSLWEGISRVRQGNINGHRRSMISLYLYAMVLTGALTLLPGRVMYTVIFGLLGNRINSPEGST